MRVILCSYLVILAILCAVPVFAQDISSTPECFQVVNEAPYKVYGTFITDYFTNENGYQARHTSNFRLEEAGAVHEDEGYPLDRAEFCTFGPFLPGHKILMVIRTLVPVFECKTRIDQGPIVITGRRKPEGGTETTAACFE